MGGLSGLLRATSLTAVMFAAGVFACGPRAPVAPGPAVRARLLAWKPGQAAAPGAAPDAGAALGNAIENGFRLYVTEQGGKLGGREVEYFTVDDESDPAKATENAGKLIKRDRV
ncbi:MAG TPA: ABC transporter substrate-binding protein, partial [Polyangiaceae bacterium]|nr:ABC transporter substrate-binding protein [Polyangiaceae bacterium]